MEDQISFYGSQQQRLFQIERYAMDAPGKVVEYLNKKLPRGLVMDLGAGDGYTANKIEGRTVLCVEPSSGMVIYDNNPLWLKGTAENLPFHDNYLDGAYSTWAYFLPGVEKLSGLKEVERVCKDRSKIIIIDNAGGDEFTSFAQEPIHEGPEFYLENGFELEVIESVWQFENEQDCLDLMSLFFPDKFSKDDVNLQYSYRVAAYSKIVQK